MDVYKKIAIIGGTGKAGRYIASKALEKGYHVRMLVRDPEKLVFRDSRKCTKYRGSSKSIKRLSNRYQCFWSTNERKTNL